MSFSSPARLDSSSPILDPSRMQVLKSDAIGKPLAHAIAGHHRHAILILDAFGVVRFATTRSMFGLQDHELPDTHIQMMIPGVPIRESTPGYNVAYAQIAFAANNWQRYLALSTDGDRFPVDMNVRALAVGHGYALLTAIREVQGGVG